MDFLTHKRCNTCCHNVHNIAGKAKWKMVVFTPQQEERGKCICWIYTANAEFIVKLITSGPLTAHRLQSRVSNSLGSGVRLDETVFMCSLISQKSNDITRLSWSSRKRRRGSWTSSPRHYVRRTQIPDSRHLPILVFDGLFLTECVQGQLIS